MSFILVIPDWRFSIPRLTNQNLLEISLTLFACFVVAEIIGTILSNSLSLLGDAASMSVDVSTYICNIYGEWAKSNNQRGTLRSRIILEVIIPSVSTLSLLGVTLYILLDAINVIRNPPLVNTVLTNYLYGYSAVNLLIDFCVSYLFYTRGDDVFIESDKIPSLSLDTSISFDQEEDDFGHLEDDLDGYMNNSSDADAGTVWNIFASNHGQGSASYQPVPGNNNGHHSGNAHCCGNFYRLWSTYFSSCCSSSPLSTTSTTSISAGSSGPVTSPVHKKHDDHHRKNLNMMSAFTHIMGDTFRTVAMFLAAFVSSVTGLDGDICDAYSALVVSLTILVLCGSLAVDIYTAGLDIYLEEYAEHSVGNSSSGTTRSSRIVGGGGSGGGNSVKTAHTPYKRVNDIDWDEVEEVEL